LERGLVETEFRLVEQSTLVERRYASQQLGPLKRTPRRRWALLDHPS